MKKLLILPLLLAFQLVSGQWNVLGWNPYNVRDTEGDSTFVLSSPSRDSLQEGIASWVPASSGGGASGIDDVLAGGQSLTANRSIDLNGYALEIAHGVGYDDIYISSGETADFPVLTLSGGSAGWKLGAVYTSISSDGDYVLLVGIPTYANDAAAGSGGVPANGLYKTSSGQLMIKL